MQLRAIEQPEMAISGMLAIVTTLHSERADYNMEMIQ